MKLPDAHRACTVKERNVTNVVFALTEEVLYLEIGDRTPADEASFPDDDLKAVFVAGKWVFAHKDGKPYA